MAKRPSVVLGSAGAALMMTLAGACGGGTLRLELPTRVDENAWLVAMEAPGEFEARVVGPGSALPALRSVSEPIDVTLIDLGDSAAGLGLTQVGEPVRTQVERPLRKLVGYSSLRVRHVEGELDTGWEPASSLGPRLQDLALPIESPCATYSTTTLWRLPYGIAPTPILYADELGRVHLEAGTGISLVQEGSTFIPTAPFVEGLGIRAVTETEDRALFVLGDHADAEELWLREAGQGPRLAWRRPVGPPAQQVTWLAARSPRAVFMMTADGAVHRVRDGVLERLYSGPPPPPAPTSASITAVSDERVVFVQPYRDDSDEDRVLVDLLAGSTSPRLVTAFAKRLVSVAFVPGLGGREGGIIVAGSTGTDLDLGEFQRLARSEGLTTASTRLLQPMRSGAWRGYIRGTALGYVEWAWIGLDETLSRSAIGRCGAPAVGLSLEGLAWRGRGAVVVGRDYQVPLSWVAVSLDPIAPR